MNIRKFINGILHVTISEGFESMPLNKDDLDMISIWKRLNINGVIYNFLKLNHSKKFVIEVDGVGEVGSASLNDYDSNFDGVYLDNIRIQPEYRRLGLATYLYKFIEDAIGEKIKPSPIKQSPEIKKYWEKNKLI
jgi:ribosomal protein S18 acetylase RimI-like enzyme